MSRKEHLEFCSVGINQSFDTKLGIDCGPTQKIADFEASRAEYRQDQNPAVHTKLAFHT